MFSSLQLCLDLENVELLCKPTGRIQGKNSEGGSGSIEGGNGKRRLGKA
jgi:hypothetical protein